MSFLILLDSPTLAIFLLNVGASRFSVTGSSFYPVPEAVSPFLPSLFPSPF